MATMPLFPTRPLGRTKVKVARMGLGCAPLGDLFTTLSEDGAEQVLNAAWDIGIRFFDTSPFYGHGKSEHRLGHFLRQQPRDQFTVSTKVGRVLRAANNTRQLDSSEWNMPLAFDLRFDYSYDGVLRSFEDSLQRLGLSSIDVLWIHDLDFMHHGTERRVDAYLAQLATGGWRALEELRSANVIKAVGAGINELGMIPKLLDVTEVELFLVALDYNLLDTGMLDAEFPLCAERDVGVIVGATFASGILATGPVDGAKHRYADATPEVIEKTRRIAEVCSRHGTQLRAAALQFPLAHPIVNAIIPGARSAHEVSDNIKLLEHPVSLDMWAELKADGLLRSDAPTPQVDPDPDHALERPATPD